MQTRPVRQLRPPALLSLVLTVSLLLVSHLCASALAAETWRERAIAHAERQRANALAAVEKAKQRVAAADRELASARKTMAEATRANNQQAVAVAREAENLSGSNLHKARLLLTKANAFLEERNRAVAAVRQAIVDPKSRGVVLADKGTIECRSADGQSATTTARGLQPGESIRTGANGQATLFFARHDSQVQLNPATEFTVNQDDDSGFSAELHQGFSLIRAVVKKKLGHKFEVRTPSAVTSVRGTEFQVQSDASGTLVQVLEGTVSVTPREGTPLTVRAGESLRVPASGEPVGPYASPAANGAASHVR